MTSATLEYGSPESLQQREKANARARALMWIGIVICAVLSVSWLWQQLTKPEISSVTISDVRAVGLTQLCPGDNLVYDYKLTARGSGLLVRDHTIWRTVPPRTLVFSDFERFIVEEPVTQSLTETYVIPKLFVDPATAQPAVLKPGDYRLLLSISSPGDKSVLDVDHVDFTIKDGCE